MTETLMQIEFRTEQMATSIALTTAIVTKDWTLPEKNRMLLLYGTNIMLVLGAEMRRAILMVLRGLEVTGSMKDGQDYTIKASELEEDAVIQFLKEADASAIESPGRGPNPNLN